MEIVPDIGDVMGKTEIETATLDADKTYTLRATQGSYVVEKPLTVKVIAGHQVKFFDWNKPVTQTEKGFARHKPFANYDWTQPVDYTQGTAYFRVVIRSQPVPQDMSLQFCIWQKIGDESEWREECDKKNTIVGTAGNIVTWSRKLESFTLRSQLPIDWTQPRLTAGVVIKNQAGCVVTSQNIENVPSACYDANGAYLPWGGENPAYWYDLDWQYTAINVVQD